MSTPGATSSTSTGNEIECIKKTLFKKAMGGEWSEVINIYQNHPDTHCAKITKSGNTAVNIAVLDGQDKVVERLVDLMKGIGVSHASKALGTENERGNAPLHYAAAMGNVRMCKCIAEVDSRLIGRRNHDGETPFFLAVLHGEKSAFLCLHSICGTDLDRAYTYCRRNDGDTILHCAITGEYLDLAFQIIHLYPSLVNRVNQQGFSPLHILAGKPSAFRSGSHVRRFNKIIYHCIFVDELVPQTFPGQTAIFEGVEYNQSAKKYPENYQTCFNFAWLLNKVFCLIVLGSGKARSKQNQDAEDPAIETSSVVRPLDPASSDQVSVLSKSNKKEDLYSNKTKGSPATQKNGHHLFPANYITCFEVIKFLSKAMLIIFGLGSREKMKMEERKQKHVWSKQVLDILLERTSSYEYEDDGMNPQQKPVFGQDGTAPYSFKDGGDVTFSASLFMTSPPQLDDDKTSSPENGAGRKRMWELSKETAILIAARNGVVEMVENILQRFPVAIHDMSADKKNIVLLAVENRQPDVYQLLLKKNIMKDTIFRKIDKDGNSALHLAAKLGDHKPWLIPGSALQMQWEIKWYEYVKFSMPLHFFCKFNMQGQTPKDIFTETHKDLVKSGGDWLTSTSESCSVVAALIATVAFATSTTVPGGVKQDEGTPTLEYEPAFDVFAIASLIALCFSVTSVVMFLAILTSRYQEKDFRTSLPWKLLLGLTSLFIAITSMLISFCAGHFFVLKDKLKYAAFPVYAITCLPVTIFAIAQFPLYFDLIRATFRTVPQRSYKVIPP